MLRWKCRNPDGAAGTIYQVQRQLSPAAGFAYLGTSGGKEFKDATIPAGCSMLVYKIRGVRSTKVGPWASFNVNFGGAGAEMAAFITRTREAA